MLCHSETDTNDRTVSAGKNASPGDSRSHSADRLLYHYVGDQTGRAHRRAAVSRDHPSACIHTGDGNVFTGLRGTASYVDSRRLSHTLSAPIAHFTGRNNRCRLLCGLLQQKPAQTLSAFRFRCTGCIISHNNADIVSYTIICIT